MKTTVQLFLLLRLFTLSVGTGNPYLLFANKNNIRLVSSASPKKNSTILIRRLRDAAVLDFYHKENLIFWTDINLEMIKRVQIDPNGTKNKKIKETNIITSGLISPDGLACDWIGRKLYWTDSETNRIEVSDLDGRNRKVLFWTDLYQTRAICVVPMHGFMFWSDWGDVPKIERASMDGNKNSRVVIVSDRIEWPNGLTVDYVEERLYFADAKLRIIESMNFDGAKRRTILQGISVAHPFALTLFDQTLYWTDWISRSILYCDKKTGKNVKKLISGSNLSPMDIHVYSPERQPNSFSTCHVNNGGCSHLCLLADNEKKYSCACPTGVKLLNNNKTCANGAQNILLLARRSDIRKISLDTEDYTDKILDLKKTKHTTAIDYDPVEGYVYWTDDKIYAIHRALLDGSGQEEIISEVISHPDGIAVDWITRNLYWTDTGTNRIEVSRLNGSSRHILFSDNLDQPRDIVVDPRAGYMYWTDWGKHARIEKAYMDGTHRRIIVGTGLGWPNGLAIDTVEEKLYWGDAKTDRIEVSDLDGNHRKVLLKDKLPHIFGLSLLGSYIYWTDWHGRRIERVHKLDVSKREVIIDHLPDLMGLKTTPVKRSPEKNSCSFHNGKCSHLCLIRPGDTYACACPMGLELDASKRSCVVTEAYLLYSCVKDIRKVSFKLNRAHTLISVDTLSEASSIDFSFKDDRIYWTDSDTKKISRAYVNGSDVEHIVEYGLEHPEGMALDWIAQNIYWTDIGYNRIEVTNIHGGTKKILIWEKMEDPRSIVLDPDKGYMYWSDWKTNKIERAALDGSLRQDFIINIGRAGGLSIDYENQKLYWSDLDSHVIEYSSLTDGRRLGRILYESSTSVHSLTLYQHYLYSSYWNRGLIERVNKTDGADKMKMHGNCDKVMDILIFHGSRQPGWNKCAVDNGGCSDFCFALPAKKGAKNTNFHTCSCPTHHKLNKDNMTCQAPKDFLLFSQKKKIKQMLFSGKTASQDVMLPIHRLKNVKAMEYDPVAEFLYWIDDKSKTIRRSHLNGTKYSVILQNKRKYFHPYDLAVDIYGRLLYWTCAKTNVINVTKIDGLRPIGSVFLSPGNKPRSIVLHPHRGFLFWVNVGKTTSIDKADFDGTHHTTLFSTDLINPTGLAIDVKEDLLFWADEGMRHIESCDIKGGNRTVIFQRGTFLPVALSVHGPSLYWIDRETQVLEKADKHTGINHRILKSRLSLLTDVLAVEYVSAKDLKNHACYTNEHNEPICSDICLVDSKDGWGRKRCSCPINQAIGSDGRNCGPRPNCVENEFTCISDQHCIPSLWQCDGKNDCRDDSDEVKCLLCNQLTQFQCTNRQQCINVKNRCDGKVDCLDGSDENDCCSGQFRCKSNRVKCIDSALICDGTPDCPDGLDESIVICESDPYAVIIANGVKDDKEQPADSQSDKIPIYVVAVACSVVFFVCLVCLFYKIKKNSRDNCAQEMSYMSSANNITAQIPLNSAHHRRETNMGLDYSVALPNHMLNLMERPHITGSSSSSSNCEPFYNNLIQPPPSVVTKTSTSNSALDYYSGHRSSSTASTLQFSRRNRNHGKHVAPQNTPVGSDYLDDSDNNTEFRYPKRAAYNTVPRQGYRSVPTGNNSGTYQHPPLHQSQHLSEDCYTSSPSSPGTVRSHKEVLYNPPPPSPVNR